MTESVKRIAIYPGTFDPITNGHLDLVERSARIFDEVIVAISSNMRKQPLFSIEERLDLVTQTTAGMENVSVDCFDELLVEFVKKKNAKFIIRGLRAVSDFEYEFQLAAANRRLNGDVETIFLTPSESNYFTSSSLVREIAYYEGEVESFVPPVVHEALVKKWASEKA
jgi:pantetheine-phosphate adenylyltransferase